MALLSTDPGGGAAVPADPEVWARLVDNSGTPREQASRLISLLFPPGTAAEIDRRFGDLVAAARAELSTETLTAQERAMAAWHDEEQPQRSPAEMPVLVVHGSEDIVIPPANADALPVRWPGARIEPIAGGGHAFMAQEPRQLADLLTSFLRG
ncbi:MAG TPA: hypothetical protein VNP96_07300 [Solirubrobacterales bacterium]|nr:hypothetical protein [Solirubrobacterales bacterium]